MTLEKAKFVAASFMDLFKKDKPLYHVNYDGIIVLNMEDCSQVRIGNDGVNYYVELYFAISNTVYDVEYIFLEATDAVEKFLKLIGENKMENR